jgi:hypothetical protein
MGLILRLLLAEILSSGVCVHNSRWFQQLKEDVLEDVACISRRALSYVEKWLQKLKGLLKTGGRQFESLI